MRHGRPGPAERPVRGRVAVVALTAVGAAVVACTPETRNPNGAEREDGLELSGPDDGALLGAADLDGLTLTLTVRSDDHDVADLRVELNGREVADDEVQRDGDTLRFTPGELDDGDHVVTVTVDPAAGAPDDDGAADTGEADAATLHEWRFTVDATPPELAAAPTGGAVVAGEPVALTGSTEPSAAVTVDGTRIDVAADGTFEVELDHDLAVGNVLPVAATDEAGNTTETAFVTVPSRVAVDEIRSVHVTFWGWADDGLREPVLEMAEEGRINSVQLDLKDESGLVGYDSQVPLAREIGAAEGIYDLEAAVAELHDRGINVIGRIVAFRDPVLAEWAWEHEPDWVIQTPDGEPYAGYDGFTSFAHPDVLEYNLAIAEEAAAAGVDDILWDYIRRPDGPAENLVVAGLSDDAGDDTMEDAIVDFTALADERLRPYGVQHGVSVYGIAATRPTEIAQDIPRMAEHVDYVAPMLYPSHWGDGEYGVADPNREPYDIIDRSLADFVTLVEGTGARIVPWLEDTDYRAWDRPTQVREQLRAAADHGIDEWLMWDPRVDYTTEVYPAR